MLGDSLRPELVGLSKANRAFLGRVVRFLTGAGIRQFIDIGAGLPTQENVHQVAQRIAPDTRVVYVDKDAAAVERGQALLEGSDTAGVIEGDLLDPQAILANPQLRELIECGISDGLGGDAQSLKSVYRGAFSTDRPAADGVSFFAGVELVDPGVVSSPLWHPDGPAEDFRPEEMQIVGGVGRKT